MSCSGGWAGRCLGDFGKDLLRLLIESMVYQAYDNTILSAAVSFVLRELEIEGRNDLATRYIRRCGLMTFYRKCGRCSERSAWKMLDPGCQIPAKRVTKQL